MIAPSEFLKYLLIFGVPFGGGGGGGVTAQEVQEFAFNYAPSSGVNDAFVVNLNPAVTTLTDGLIVSMSSGVLTNLTDTPTLQVNALAPKNIVLWSGAVAPGDVEPGGSYLFVYDGDSDNFQLINPSVSTANAFFVQANEYNTGIDTGAANAYDVTLLIDPPTPFSPGFPIYLQVGVGNTNTGSSTITVNGNADSILNPDGSELTADSLIGGQTYLLVYNGTYSAWVVLNSSQLGVIDGTDNLLIGADFSLNPWQRGTTFAALASGSYSADRWRLSNSTDAVMTVSKSTDAPTVAQAGYFSQHSLSIEVTTADAAIGAAQLAYKQQLIEGYNYAPIAQQPFTLSFWVKSSVTGIYCVSFQNAGTDRSFVAEFTVNAANTWEKKIVHVDAPPSGGTWNYTNGIGLTCVFCLGAGANFHTTPDAWQVGGFFATANQVNFLATIGNTFKVDLLQIEKGTIATPFKKRSVQQELNLSQRYYWKTFQQGVTPAQAAGTVGQISYMASFTGVGNQGDFNAYPVPMRTTATLTSYSPQAASANWYNQTGLSASGGFTVGSASDRGFFANNVQVAGDNQGSLIGIHVAADAEL